MEVTTGIFTSLLFVQCFPQDCKLHEGKDQVCCSSCKLTALPSLAHGSQPSSLVERMPMFQTSPQTVLRLSDLQLKCLNTPVLAPTRAKRGATVQTGTLRLREVLPKVPRG